MTKAAGDRASVLHSETREELARADAKATTLLSVTGLIIGALLAGAIAGDWRLGSSTTRSSGRSGRGSC